MKKKVSKTKISNPLKKPIKDKDLAVSKRLLNLATQELDGKITSLRLEMRAGFAKVDAQLAPMQSDSANLKSDVTTLKSDVAVLKSDVAVLKLDMAEVKVSISGIETKMTRMMVILEEQNDRNRAALDGYAAVYERFNDTEYRLKKLEEKTFGTSQR